MEIKNIDPKSAIRDFTLNSLKRKKAVTDVMGKKNSVEACKVSNEKPKSDENKLAQMIGKTDAAVAASEIWI